VIDQYGAALLGRLRRYAARYGAHVCSEVEDVFYQAVETLLDPEVRAACRARGGQILPWLSKFGKWRIADVAKGYEGKVPVESLETAGPAPQTPNAVAPSPLVEALLQLLPRLSPRDQLVLNLRYRESASMEEIGAQLGIGVPAAKKAVFDARRRLQRLMEAEGVAPE
jgi:DNA-directed RNA polymerase specialized sigma24 family protein